MRLEDHSIRQLRRAQGRDWQPPFMICAQQARLIVTTSRPNEGASRQATSAQQVKLIVKTSRPSEEASRQATSAQQAKLIVTTSRPSEEASRQATSAQQARLIVKTSRPSEGASRQATGTQQDLLIWRLISEKVGLVVPTRSPGLFADRQTTSWPSEGASSQEGTLYSRRRAAVVREFLKSRSARPDRFSCLHTTRSPAAPEINRPLTTPAARHWICRAAADRRRWIQPGWTFQPSGNPFCRLLALGLGNL